ncbi:hypothetical protein, partial [Bifidobacterium longum]
QRDHGRPLKPQVLQPPLESAHPDMIRPASCDGLNAIKHCERLFFVEYKNGNVVAKNGQTNEITLKSKTGHEY